VDDNVYVDYWMGHGALILGHCHPEMVEAVQKQVALGTHFGACHELELEWAEWVKRLVPSAQQVRFTSSGTEATMMALRLARTFTGKGKALRFFGHFHGWHDFVAFGVKPPFDEPPPIGIHREVSEKAVLCAPNDIEAVERALSSDDDIGCVILEPTGASFGAVPTRPGFLEELREVTARHDVLLVFDEVVTGFRCAPGGAQEFYGVMPDLTSLAKILAGGLPGGCLAGREDVLEILAFKGDPEWDRVKKMPHHGTYNANPLSAVAGIATLKAIADGTEIAKANANAEQLRQRLRTVMRDRQIPWTVYGDFTGFKVLAGYDGGDDPADRIQAGQYDFRKLKAGSPDLARAFHSALLLEGVDMSGWNGLTASTHTQQDLDDTVQAFDKALGRLLADGAVRAA